jgi:hypothetical protein
MKSLNKFLHISTLAWFLAIGTSQSFGQSNPNDQLTSARTSNVITSNSISSVITSGVMGGTGAFRMSLGRNNNYQFNPSSVIEAKQALPSVMVDNFKDPEEADLAFLCDSSFVNDLKIAHDSNHINQGSYLLNAHDGGLAGSVDLSNWSIWGTPVFSQFSNNIQPYTSNGSVKIALIGIEHNYEDTFISGVSFAFDSTNADTYNGTFNSRGATVSPYLVYVINDSLTADISMGFGVASLSSSSNGTGGPNYGSSVDHRYFLATGLTKRSDLGNKFSLTSRIVFNYFKDGIDSYVDSTGTSNAAVNTNLSQLKLGGQLAYETKRITPFFALYGLANSFNASTSQTTQEYSASYQTLIGVNFSKEPFFGTVAYQMERDRSQFRLYGGIRF